MRRQTTIALGSAGGLPTVPSAFTWYGGSDEPTARAMMGRMKVCSFFLNRLYLLQSLGLERLPWFLLSLRLFWWCPLALFFFVVHVSSRLEWNAYPGGRRRREKKRGYAFHLSTVIVQASILAPIFPLKVKIGHNPGENL